MKAPIVWHNPVLHTALEAGLSARDIRQLLKDHDCLTFPQLPSGLFPAINLTDISKDRTTYADSWLRDSSNVAVALWQDGEIAVAQAAARGVLACLGKVAPAFRHVIKQGAAPEDPAQRPAARFTGLHANPHLEWANAQNDALGYSMRLIGLLVAAGDITLTPEELTTLELVPEYLQAISYWKDQDNGHWEEVPKLNASSVGAALAGLTAIRPLLDSPTTCDLLIANGRKALDSLLPRESDTPGLVREYDASLLFLVEPLQVVSGTMAATIVERITQKLVGDQGVRRYPGDSYWGPDYRDHFKMGQRAGNFSRKADLEARDRYLKSGQEAQWALFDSLIATYHAKRFAAGGKVADKVQADYFLARALGQIIAQDEQALPNAPWRLPEAFFMEHGGWVPNDHLGLLWGEANLLYALDSFAQLFGDQLIAIPEHPSA